MPGESLSLVATEKRPAAQTDGAYDGLDTDDDVPF
jgi:hypothetical protein